MNGIEGPADLDGPVTFVGDVHGWTGRLRAVLDQAVGVPVLMGDLIDRGPDAAGTLRLAHAWCASGRARCLLGNHEFALIQALGHPAWGIGPDSDWFAGWRDRYGGAAVLDSFGVRDADGLRAAMGPLLDWLAGLPWVLTGCHGGARWVAVHAGLDPEIPWDEQVAWLRRGWDGEDDRPEHLYSKAWSLQIPDDLPGDTVVVSGHTPQRTALVEPHRILCDTTGGMPDRSLSGVQWPSGRIVVS